MFSRLMYAHFCKFPHLFQFNRVVSHKMPTFSLLEYVAGFSQLKTSAQHELTQPELDKITEYFHFFGRWAYLCRDDYKALEQMGMSVKELRDKKIAMSREIIMLIESKNSDVQKSSDIKLKLIMAYETLIKHVPVAEEEGLLAKLEHLDPKNHLVLQWHGGSDMFPEVKSDYETRKALRESKAVDASSDTGNTSSHDSNQADTVSYGNVEQGKAKNSEERGASSSYSKDYALFAASGRDSSASKEAERVSMQLPDAGVPRLK